MRGERAHDVGALLEEATAGLALAGVEDPSLEAELLLAGILRVARLRLKLGISRAPTSAERTAFQHAVARRTAREPLQYILGEAAFRELVLGVDPRVLVPRPETEQLVGAVLEWGTGRSALTALDIGTGSGAIALSLLLEGPFVRVVATDASADALEVAGENARRLGLADRLGLRRGPGWSTVAEGERFDVVVSNPPYVAESEREGLQPEVGEWEPAGALFGGPEGLDVLRELASGAAERLRPGGLLALEMAPTQTATVAAWLRSAPGLGGVRVLRDLAGLERMVLAERIDDGGETDG